MSYYLVDSPIPDFPRITHFGYCNGEDGRSIPRHYHVGYEIVYIRNGHALVETLPNEPPVELTRDMVFVMAPTIEHTFRIGPSNIEYFWIGVQTDLVIHVSEDHRISPRALIHRGDVTVRDLAPETHYDELIKLGKSLHLGQWAVIERCPEVAPIFETMHREIASDQFMRTFVVYAKVIELFSLIHRRLSPYRHTSRSSVLNRVIDYVQAHYTEQLTVEHLARFAGFHQSHLSRLFYRETGTKLSSFVRRVRMDNAKRMLFDGASVSEVALQCGFHNIYAFSSAFKRECGVSPSAYRSGPSSPVNY
ncbi:helix-turn-helix domain-containing protein [Salinispira pacifica]